MFYFIIKYKLNKIIKAFFNRNQRISLLANI